MSEKELPPASESRLSADGNERVAIITGGRGDLAQAIAAALQREGWQVLAPDRNEMDVRDATSVRAWFAQRPRIDAMIGNAGIVRDGLFVRSAEEDIDEVLSVNLRGAYLCAQAALPSMRLAGGGHLLWIGSWAARNGTAGQSTYAASKAGLIGLSQSLARELAPENIRSNVVLPGFLQTKMNRHMPEAALRHVLAQHTLGRLNTVQEAARFIACLCSMQHVSGQVFQLDSRIGRSL
ncbi:MAG: SDR family NAD(P)-dependent oxidoreductase [Candidatus Methylacidiphilales bacterium]